MGTPQLSVAWLNRLKRLHCDNDSALEHHEQMCCCAYRKGTLWRCIDSIAITPKRA